MIFIDTRAPFDVHKQRVCHHDCICQKKFWNPWTYSTTTSHPETSMQHLKVKFLKNEHCCPGFEDTCIQKTGCTVRRFLSHHNQLKFTIVNGSVFICNWFFSVKHILDKTRVTVIVPEIFFINGSFPHGPAKEVHRTTEYPPHATKPCVSNEKVRVGKFEHTVQFSNKGVMVLEYWMIKVEMLKQQKVIRDVIRDISIVMNHRLACEHRMLE